jgi:hypothetical protein
LVDRRGRRHGDEGGLEGGATTDGKENEGRRLIGPASILSR